MKYLKDSIPSLPASLTSAESEWTSPSNIALVKYWGKSAGQIPKNPSLSFSLCEAVSSTKVKIRPSPNRNFELAYLFEGKDNEAFATRIRTFIEGIFPYFPFLRESSLEISSTNTFPHSSGIASSASSMSALALCLCAIEQEIRKHPHRDEAEIQTHSPQSITLKHSSEFYKKASYMARLGSGSASRSVYGSFVSWGIMEGIPDSSDEYATALDISIGSSFRSLCDAVLIVSPIQKKISSSKGHELMNTHPYAVKRYEQAGQNFTALVNALRNNDVGSFIRITENEALTLHGLMMSSDPGFVLLEPASLEIIRRIRKYRQDTGSFLTFTIDAGPNIHMIYPIEDREAILDLIESELKPYCFEGKWIDDRMGAGPIEHASD